MKKHIVRPLYRAYSLASDGDVASVTILDSHDAELACLEASLMRNDHGIELWEGTRLVNKLPGGGCAGGLRDKASVVSAV